MIASADTSIWVRYLTNDNPPTAQRVLAWLAAAEQVHLPVTVLLELEWVLRAAYKFGRHDVQRALRQVVGLPNVTVAQPDAVAKALAWHADGMDFADGLHAALSPDELPMVTLDETLVSSGSALGVPVREL